MATTTTCDKCGTVLDGPQIVYVGVFLEDDDGYEPATTASPAKADLCDTCQRNIQDRISEWINPARQAVPAQS